MDRTVLYDRDFSRTKAIPETPEWEAEPFLFAEAYLKVPFSDENDGLRVDALREIGLDMFYLAREQDAHICVWLDQTDRSAWVEVSGDSLKLNPMATILSMGTLHRNEGEAMIRLGDASDGKQVSLLTRIPLEGAAPTILQRLLR